MLFEILFPGGKDGAYMFLYIFLNSLLFVLFNRYHSIYLFVYLPIYQPPLPFTVLPVELSKCEGSSLACHVTAPMTYRCQRRFQSVRIVRFGPFIIFSQQLYLFFFYRRCLCVWYFATLLFPIALSMKP